MTPETLDLFYPSGQPFLTSVQLARRTALETERVTRAAARAEQEAARAGQEAARAEHEAARASAAQEHADRLVAYVRALGLDPDGPEDCGDLRQVSWDEIFGQSPRA